MHTRRGGRQGNVARRITFINKKTTIKLFSFMYNYKKAIFMASALLCLNMTAAAQQVSLNVNKVSVKQAMNQLKEKTGYTFVFSSSDINNKQIVSVSANNADLAN